MSSLDKNKIEIKSFVYDWGLIFSHATYFHYINPTNYLE